MAGGQSDSADNASPGEVPSAESMEQVAAAAEELAERLARLRGPALLDAPGTAARLCQLERQAVEFAQRLGELDPNLIVLDRRSVLAELTRWSQLSASLGLGAESQTAMQAAAGLFTDELCAWRRMVESLGECPEPARCFNLLMQATVLELEALASFYDWAESRECIASLRRPLRQKLLDALQRRGADAGQRADWTTTLLDRADVVLRAIDEVAPAAAEAQLAVMADDLRWHLEHVERGRGPLRRGLRRKWRRVTAERQERVLHDRLEARIGETAAAWLERVVLLLIGLVLVLLAVEASFQLSARSLFWLHVADAAACVVFLFEFAVKWCLVPGRWRWFWRHFAIDLVPSIPFGLLLGAYGADSVRVGRLGRLLRLPRLARYVRLLRPVVRLFRAFGFLVRGTDRLARMYESVINRDIILYPTRGEREQSRPGPGTAAGRLRELLAELDQRWRDLLLGAAGEQRPAIAARRVELLRSLTDLPARTEPKLPPTRELSLEALWRQLGALTPQQVKFWLHPDLIARLARVTRLFARPPCCWLPIVGRYVPRIGPRTSDVEVIVAGAHRLASVLKRYHDRLFWVADLYGTITPTQFIDRVGTLLVRNSVRPAYRLALFGGFFLLTELLLHVMNLRALAPVEAFLDRYVGPALVGLGGLCLIILAFGWWLQRLAREATEFYQKAVEAQFLALTEIIRAHYLERDAAILYRRVLLPERLFSGQDGDADGHQDLADFTERVRLALVGIHRCGQTRQPFDPIERIVLLYRDSLDGALLCLSDNRTTNQLLGNPALRQLERQSWRMHRREVRRLRRLDLERQQGLFGGPYLWFNLIARAMSHGAARLVLDYNRHAVPLADLPLASEQQRARYRRWLQADSQPTAAAARHLEQLDYATNAFTALHLLDCQAERDQDVAERFGPEVLRRLRRDRALLFRRVFGTYPLHLRPKAQRVLNPYRIYEQWLAGGRVLLLPWFLLVRGVRQGARLLRWLVQAVGEIRHPERRVDPADAAEADFATAVRKIERMRGPVVYACLRLRSWIDPEYLGVPLPGQQMSPPNDTDLQADLRFLDPDPWTLEELADQRRRVEADMRRLEQLISEGLLRRAAGHIGAAPGALSGPEHIRAAAAGYVADLRGLRSHLSAAEIVREVYQAAALEATLPPRLGLHLAYRRMFRRWCRQYGLSDRLARRAAWRATVHNHWGVADALRVWFHQGPEAARSRGEHILAELLRHPHRVSEQLVTLRAVQTLAMLDVLNYRQHVFQTGNYAASGDRADELLHWPAPDGSMSGNVVAGQFAQ